MTKEEKDILAAKLKNIISNMPEGPGSYQYYDEHGEIIYVGKAKNLKRRVSSYFTKEQNRKTAILVSKIRDIKYINVATEQDALLLENSKFKGEASFRSVIERAKAAKGADASGDRAEFIRLAERAEAYSIVK